MEIDENLCRAELTAAQRGAAIRRRKEIWVALNLGGTTGATQLATLHKDRPQNKEQFAAATASASGMTKKDINCHLARAAVAYTPGIA